MTVDIFDYLDFIFTQPLHERVGRRSIDNEARAVARTLAQVADRTGLHEIRQLATRIILMDFHMEIGDVAPPKVIFEFLRVHEQRLSTASCEAARRALENLTPRSKTAMLGCVEYRGPGGAEYYCFEREENKQKKHWPDNDLTFRLDDAYWALKDAGCPHPVAHLARRLNELTQNAGIWTPETYWTSNKIESRIKPYKKFGRRSWVYFPWRERYWLYLNRGNLEKTRCGTDQPFEFVWVGAHSPASRDENERSTPLPNFERSSLPPWL